MNSDQLSQCGGLEVFLAGEIPFPKQDLAKVCCKMQVITRVMNYPLPFYFPTILLQASRVNYAMFISKSYVARS